MQMYGCTVHLSWLSQDDERCVCVCVSCRTNGEMWCAYNMVAEELRWESSLGWCRHMCEEFAKTKLDTALYFLPVILLTFEYFYLYLPEKQLLIFSNMALLN